jgi:hypothetical protein
MLIRKNIEYILVLFLLLLITSLFIPCSANANDVVTIETGTIGNMGDIKIKYNGTNHWNSRFYLAPGISNNATNIAYSNIKNKIHKFQYHHNQKPEQIVKFKVIGLSGESITIIKVE